jgi:hypothetical protein
VFLGAPIKAEVLLHRHTGPPVDGDIRHSDEFHLVLPGHGVGDTLSDHAIAVDSDPNLFRLAHLLLLAPEALRWRWLMSPLFQEIGRIISRKWVDYCPYNKARPTSSNGVRLINSLSVSMRGI